MEQTMQKRFNASRKKSPTSYKWEMNCALYFIFRVIISRILKER